MNDLKPKNPVEAMERFFDEDNMMNMNGSAVTAEQWLKTCTEEAMRIAPEIAEVDWCYGQILDPYGTEIDLRDEEKCIGRNYFARNPGSDVWVWFGDLAEETRRRLWDMHSSKLAFPAGLPAAFLET